MILARMPWCDLWTGGHDMTACIAALAPK